MKSIGLITQVTKALKAVGCPRADPSDSGFVIDTGLMKGTSDQDWPDWVAEALGPQRMEVLEDLGGQVDGLRELTGDASTMDIVLRPLKGAAIRKWELIAQRQSEDWVYIAGPEGTTVWALDEPSEDAGRDPAGAVIYPELHTRLVSWWLVHAWRGVDLIEDTLDNLRRWRITSAAVTARAVVEEAGALADEARKIAAAWTVAKAAGGDRLKRPEAVHAELAPVLLHAQLGSRLKIGHEKLQATNVLTLVRNLAKATQDARFTDWYDWLSDSAHPALGARIAFASPPFVHDSNAVTIRWYARSPIIMRSAQGSEQLEPTIALIAADALAAVGSVIIDVLTQALAVVDDMGLTTGAATLTRYSYWRNFFPVRGTRPCPCGRGKASQCQHYWDRPAPGLAIPVTAVADHQSETDGIS